MVLTSNIKNTISKYLIQNKFNVEFKWLLMLDNFNIEELNMLTEHSISCSNMMICFLLSSYVTNDIGAIYNLIKKFINCDDFFNQIMMNQDKDYFFKLAVARNDFEICEKLYKMFDIQLTLEMLKIAVEKKHIDIIIFIFMNIKLEKKGYFFEWLIKKSHITIFKILLKQTIGNVDIEEDYPNILTFAIHEELEELTKWIFKYGKFPKI